MALTKVLAALLFCSVVVLALSAQGEAQPNATAEVHVSVRAVSVGGVGAEAHASVGAAHPEVVAKASPSCKGLLNTYTITRKVKLTPLNPGFLSINNVTPQDCERNCNFNCDCKSWSHVRRIGMRNNTIRVCTLYKARVTIYKSVDFNSTIGARNVVPPPKCPVVKPAGACTANSTFTFSIIKQGCGVSDVATVTYKGIAKAGAGAVISLGPLVNANFVSQTCQVNNNNCNVCEDRVNKLLVVTVSKARAVTITTKVKSTNGKTCINVPGRILTTCGVSNLNA